MPATAPTFAGPEPASQALLRVPVDRDKNVTSMLSPAVGALVTELASGLEPMLTVMQRYGLSKQQMRGLLDNDVFRAALVEAKAAYTATANAADRIKVKAQLAVEELMVDMVGIAGHPAHSPAARVMAYNAIKSLTGLEKPEPQPQKQRFNLTINLPSTAGPATDNQTAPNQITIDAEAYVTPLQTGEDDENSTYVLTADDDGVDRGGGGVLYDAGSDGHPSISLAGSITDHQQFKRGAKGYVERNDEQGHPVNIITSRPL